MSDPIEVKDRVKTQGPGVYVTKFGIFPTTCIVEEQVDDTKQPHMLTFLKEEKEQIPSGLFTQEQDLEKMHKM